MSTVTAAEPASYRVPDNISWVDGANFGLAEELYLTTVPEGTTVLLKDTARLIWLVAIEGGDVLAEVSALAGQPEAEIQRDVSEFLRDLRWRGLIAPRCTCPWTPPAHSSN